MDAAATLPRSAASMAAASAVVATLPPRRFAGLLALLILAAYPEIIFGTHSFFYRDFTLFGYPLAFHLKESFWRGELPLWNPLNNCGLPFLAQWNTMVLYPPSLFYVLLPLPWSLGVFNLAHLFLGGMGMYFLARRWTGNELGAGVAGTAFAFSGLCLHSLMWPSSIAALGWMPWVVWLVERGWKQGGRSLLLASVVAATQALTGAPEIIAFTWWISIGLFLATLWKPAGTRVRWSARFALIMLLVGGLTCAQMLPFLDFLLHSQRSRDFGGDVWAMPAWGWANLLVPLFHCTPSRIGVFSQDAQQWTSSYYMGIGVLALAITGVCCVRRPVVWFFAAIAIGGLVLALGGNGHVLDGLKKVFPLLGFIRFPIKFVVLTALAVPLLAAFGFDWVQRRAGEKDPAARRQLLSIVVLLLACVAVIGLVALYVPVENESGSRTAANAATRAIFLILIPAAAWIVARDQSRVRCGGLVLLVAIGFDGWTHAPRLSPTVTSAAFGSLRSSRARFPYLGESRVMLHPVTQSFLEYASPHDPAEIVLGHRRALFSNCNLIEGVPKLGGFYPLYLKEEAEMRAMLDRTTNFTRAPLADFLGVSQISSPSEMFSWNIRTNAMPLITAGQEPVFAGRPETLAALASSEFDPRAVVYLPAEARGSISAAARSRTEVISSRVNSHRVEAEVEASAPAMVIVAQAFYHPWRATVDGRPVRLWRADHAFQALEVPAGRHRVQLVYRDRIFEIGVIVSAVTLFTLVVGWFRLPKEIRPGR